MIELRSANVQSDAQPLPTKFRFVHSGFKNSATRFRALLRPQTFSFKHRAALMAIILAAVPSFAVGVISYTIFDRTSTDAIVQREHEIAKAASLSVQAYMTQRYTEIQALANLPILNDVQLYNAVPQAEKTAILQRMVQVYSSYSNIAVFSPNGDVLLQAGDQKLSDQKSENQANQAYFRATLDADAASRNAVVTLDPATATLYLSTAVREAATGKTIAVVRTTLSTHSLGELLQHSTERDYRLIDVSGRVVTASNLGLSKVDSDNLTEKSQVWTDPQTKQQYLLTQNAVTKFDRLPSVDWRLVLSSPADQAFRFRQSSALMLAFGSGVAVFAALIALLLSKRLTRHLASMSGIVQATDAAELPPKLAIETHDEVAVLGRMINQLTAQVEAARQAQQQSVKRLQQLNEAAFNIRKSADFDTIVQTGVREVRQMLNVDRAIVYLFDPDWKGTVVAESVALGIPAALGAKIADPCFAERYVDKYRAGRVHSIPDLDAAEIDDCYRGQLEQFQVKANLVAPMVVEGQLIGLLVVHQCRSARYWQDAEMNLLVQVALHLGYAIEQVSLAAQVALSQAKHQQKEALSHQLVELLGQAEKAASGDLTIRARVSGEEVGTVADFFNVIVENLERIVHQVKQSALQVNTSLDYHEIAVRSLSEDALKQSEETALTLDHIQQLVQSIQAVAQHAQQAAQVSQSAASTAEVGRVAVNDTVQDIATLRLTMGETAKKVKRLGESAQQISKAISLINQIELQTNVLAINAGIEAARTIENQGFTVIAEEVGALAAKAAGATQEISQLVANIQQETIDVVDAIEQSTAQVVTGTQSAEYAKQSLEKIMAVSSDIDQLVRSILEATVSQVSTSTTMTELMQTIAEVAEQTSSSSLQVSSSLRQTMDIAKSLQDSVQTFKVGVC